MFGLPLGGGMPVRDMLALMEERTYQLFDEFGLSRGTDSASPAGAFTGGILSVLAGLEIEAGEREEYDDRPAIERILAGLRTSAKNMKRVRSSSFRALGCHPKSCAALIAVVGTYTPPPDERANDVTALSTWSLSLLTSAELPAELLSAQASTGPLADSAAPKHMRFTGDVMDHAGLTEAFETLQGMCVALLGQHGLTPVPKYPNYGGGFGVPLDHPPSVATEGR